MKVKIDLTDDIRILGLDERSLKNLLWCALSFRMDRLLWVDGYLLCIEVFEKCFEYEVKEGFFPIIQICYTKYPKYEKLYEVEKGAQIPIVNVSDMKIYKEIVKKIEENQEDS